MVGKDVTDRIVAEQGRPDKSSPYRDWHILEGDNLKVGGEGMKGFYDKIIPDYMNKFGKKWGAKVEESKISGGKTKDMFMQEAEEDGTFYIRGPMGLVTSHEIDASNLSMSPARFKNEVAMEKALERLNAQFNRGHTGEETVHSFPITPEMRSHVLKKGLPLFSAIPAAVGLAGKEEEPKTVGQRGVRLTQ